MPPWGQWFDLASISVRSRFDLARRVLGKVVLKRRLIGHNPEAELAVVWVVVHVQRAWVGRPRVLAGRLDHKALADRVAEYPVGVCER